jgi:hypothetical protein
MPEKSKSKKEESGPDLADVREQAQTFLLGQLAPKVFSSGKTGFYATNKVVIDGIRYQGQIQLVKIAGQD